MQVSDAFARSYYDVLSVGPNATEQQIHEQYRKLVRLHHPDQYRDANVKLRQGAFLAEINSANDVLASSDRRYYYDLVSKRGLQHDAWTTLPNNNDLIFLKRAYGPVPTVQKPAPVSLADQLADSKLRQRFVERSLAAGAPLIEDSQTQLALLRALRSQGTEDLAEVVAAKFVLKDPAVARELVELKKTAFGVALAEHALNHRRTNQVLNITQNEAIEDLHTRMNDTNLDVSRRARQALYKLGLPLDRLYPLQNYLKRVQRCYGEI